MVLSGVGDIWRLKGIIGKQKVILLSKRGRWRPRKGGRGETWDRWNSFVWEENSKNEKQEAMEDFLQMRHFAELLCRCSAQDRLVFVCLD